MGKRSDFTRNPRDYYPTPREAVVPLIPHLPSVPFFYDEPCAGDGRLVQHLPHHATCISMSDIEPQVPHVTKQDALSIEQCYGSMFITNPPWNRETLHPMMEHLVPLAPCWFLLDADWMHTRQSAQYMKWCAKIVSIGRVKWIEGSKMTGKDNCVWMLFQADHQGAAEYYGRVL